MTAALEGGEWCTTSIKIILLLMYSLLIATLEYSKHVAAIYSCYIKAVH